jgi:glycosyltransferase involved in cell wall biosynthesis
MKSNVTVITASYNSQKYLRQTVESVAKQTQLPFEHLIIDDCSKDNSYQLAKQLEQEYPHVRVIKHEVNKGFPGALNTAIAAAQTEYLALLDSDDIAYPDWLAVTTNLLNEHPNIGLVGGGGNIMTEQGEVTDYFVYADHQGNLTDQIKTGAYLILHPGTVYRKSCLEAIHGYRENLKSTEDNDMYLNMAYTTELFHLGRPLIYYRRLASSESRKTEAFATLADTYTHRKSQLLASGLSITETDLALTDIVQQLQTTPRLEATKAGRYEKEMAGAFRRGKHYWLAAKYYFLALLKK